MFSAPRVDLHYETVRLSILNGKDVYYEWPLASNAKVVEELRASAKANNSRTIFGLQGELPPMIRNVKSSNEQDNVIGKVLSSSIVAAGGTSTHDRMTEELKDFT